MYITSKEEYIYNNNNYTYSNSRFAINHCAECAH